MSPAYRLTTKTSALGLADAPTAKLASDSRPRRELLHRLHWRKSHERGSFLCETRNRRSSRRTSAFVVVAARQRSFHLEGPAAALLGEFLALGIFPTRRTRALGGCWRRVSLAPSLFVIASSARVCVCVPSLSTRPSQPPGSVEGKNNNNKYGETAKDRAAPGTAFCNKQDGLHGPDLCIARLRHTGLKDYTKVTLGPKQHI